MQNDPEPDEGTIQASRNGAVMATSALDAARIDLASRLQLAYDHDDYVEAALLSPLAGVADMVCRIGDHRQSAHYRADKSGDLVLDALRTRDEAMIGHAHTSEAGDAIHEATELVLKLERAMESALWTIARGEPTYSSLADRLNDAVWPLVEWAKSFGAGAGPDPT